MNIQDFLNGFLGSIPIAAIAIFFVKRFIDSHDKESDKAKESINVVVSEVNSIKIKLAEIQGDIREAISIRNSFKDMERNVWTLDSQMKAAWKYIDKINE